jgi:hypothetical protein
MNIDTEIQRVKEDIEILQTKLKTLENLKENKKGKSIRDIIDRWWDDIFSVNSSWSKDTCTDDLADQIELYIIMNLDSYRKK